MRYVPRADTTDPMHARMVGFLVVSLLGLEVAHAAPPGWPAEGVCVRAQKRPCIKLDEADALAIRASVLAYLRPHGSKRNRRGAPRAS